MKILKCDVMVMIWGMTGRDPEALIPIIYLLKEKYKLKVKVCSIADYLSLHLYRPKVLLLNGCTGSVKTYQMSKYAKSLGIYVVSQHAEGLALVRDEAARNGVWCHNKELKPTVDTWFVWSKVAYDLVLKYHQQLEGALKVSGSVGHEKYKIFKNTPSIKSKLLKNKRCNNIILYLGGGFNRIDNNPLTKVEDDYLKLLIEKSRDSLIILKYHPSMSAELEKENITKYKESQKDNLLIIFNEIPIYELVKSADLVLHFFSTVFIDVTMLDKPIINLNNGIKLAEYPTFKDAELVAKDSTHLEMLLAEFNRTGTIEAWKQKREYSKEAIINSLGNYESESPSKIVAEEVCLYMKKRRRKPEIKPNIKYILISCLNFAVYFLRFIPNSMISGYTFIRETYQPKVFQDQYETFFPYLEKYFEEEKNHLDE